jgi:hypothetical protein
MSVVSRSEAGRRGYVAMLARYGEAQVNRWRRTGGRKPNPTYAEIIAAENAAERAKKAVTRQRRRMQSRREDSLFDQLT